MKNIPYELNKKLLQNVQAESTNSAPSMKVIATQSTINTLLSETIHKNIKASYGDVAIRQIEGESSPSIAYALCLNNGMATMYERKFPAYMDNPWMPIWALGEATDVAVEFNGTWEIDSKKQWYRLQTELAPYIFFVRGGTLYVQKWQDEQTRIPLADGVLQISVCRGWQSSDDMLLDQGLIVGYLKSGSVFYRPLCLQESGELLWETERQVTELGSQNASICVFRTNDFRVGFITEKNGEMQYVLSTRTYAGQSVRPEAVFSQVTEKCYLRAAPIAYRSAFDSKAQIKSSISQPDCYIGNCRQYPILEVVSTERISDEEYLITTNHKLLQRLPLEQFIKITPDVTISGAPYPVSVAVQDNSIRIMANKGVSKNQQVIISLQSYSSLRFYEEDTSWLLVSNFSAIFPPEALLDDNPSLMASPQVTVLNNLQLSYAEYEHTENINIACNYSCTLAAIQVGVVPI